MPTYTVALQNRKTDGDFAKGKEVEVIAGGKTYTFTVDSVTQDKGSIVVYGSGTEGGEQYSYLYTNAYRGKHVLNIVKASNK